jgi:3'-phosphoadenosine 5'-phosphosulfate sulfotransferase (PAPS reductase)/FAD synthetase
MSEEAIEVLERKIQMDLEVIDGLYATLGDPLLDYPGRQESLIVTAFWLHRLYTAFESIFRNIATTFENHLEPDGWQRQLLRQMHLDLTPLRPAVVDAETYEKLDEMLRFRNIFLSAYELKLDSLRLRIVLRKALDLKRLYRPQIEGFLGFLRTMGASS